MSNWPKVWNGIICVYTYFGFRPWLMYLALKFLLYKLKILNLYLKTKSWFLMIEWFDDVMISCHSFKQYYRKGYNTYKIHMYSKIKRKMFSQFCSNLLSNFKIKFQSMILHLMLSKHPTAVNTWWTLHVIFLNTSQVLSLVTNRTK